MKITTKSLGIGIVIGLVVSISVIFILVKDVILPTSSVYPEDLTKPIQQYYQYSNIGSCSQIKEINDSYRTCIISNSNASGIGNLPSPIFKYFNPGGASNYPPPAGFFQVGLKTNLLSQEQVEKVIDVIKNDPGIKSQSFAWKIRDMGFYPFKYSWYDDVRLVIHGIRDSSERISCGWYSTVTIDLNTLTITKRENIDVISYEKC